MSRFLKNELNIFWYLTQRQSQMEENCLICMQIQTMKAQNTRKEKSALNLKFTSLSVDLWALRNVHCKELRSQLQDECSDCAILVNLTFLIHKEASNSLSMRSSEHPDSYLLERIYALFKVFLSLSLSPLLISILTV